MPLNPSEEPANGDSLGWGTFNKDGNRYDGHSGDQQGTNTDFLLAVDQRAGVVVLTNMEGTEPNDLSLEILEALVRTTGNMPKK